MNEDENQSSSEKIRRPVERYVIPAHRNRKDSKTESDKKETVINKESESADISFHKLTLNEIDPPDDVKHSDTDVSLCCIIVYGFPFGIPPEAKENMIARFYSSGGKSRWLRSTNEDEKSVVLFAYSSIRKASTILSKTHPTLCACLLEDYENEDYLPEAKTGTSLLTA